MSAKSDSATITTASLASKAPSNESVGQKNPNTTLKKIANTSVPKLPNKDLPLPIQTTSSPEIQRPQTQVPKSSAISFTGRFLTKTPLRALTIDTSNEASSFDEINNNRLGSYSATHNPANQHVHTSNSLISSLSGNLSAKYSRAFESYRRPTQTSPSRDAVTSKSLILSKPLIASSFPYSTTNQTSTKASSILGNDFANSLISSLTPTSLHFKKLTSKSYSQDRYKTALNNPFDKKKNQTDQYRKASTPLGVISSETSRSFNTNESLDSIRSSQRRLETSIYSIFSNSKVNMSTSSAQTPTGQKFMMPIPNHEPTKCSVKRNGIVKAYAANTNQGIVRNYNEDRVAIILNIMKPASRANEEWPKCSFFGVYDGHGGVACADFLRDNLHQYVIKEPSFPWNPKEALFKGFEAAEKAFLELAENGPNRELNRSGSCALTVLIVGDMCYVANVGDSRAVMSGDGGAKIYPLSKDHKPSEDNEQKRIIEAGGKIYQSQGPALKHGNGGTPVKNQMQLLLGPHRVLPGRLSVSRTFGDIEAKATKFGGNPNVVIAIPEIKAFRINADYDFIVLATDGIYDKLSSRDTIKSVWETTRELAPNIHHQCGYAVENILREAINRRTLDNVTVVMICFKNFKEKLFPQEMSQKSETQELSQRDSDTSDTPKASLNSARANPNLSSKESIKKEKPNLLDKVNINEKESSIEKLNEQAKSPQIELPNDITISPNIKKSSTSVKANSVAIDPSEKKENTKEKESVPVNDTNIASKKGSNKRGVEGAKFFTGSAPSNQENRDSQANKATGIKT